MQRQNRKPPAQRLVCSGEITRQAAIDELQKATYPIDMQTEDKAYVAKKFGLTEQQFEEIMALPRKTFFDYPSYEPIYQSRIFKALLQANRALRQALNRVPTVASLKRPAHRTA